MRSHAPQKPQCNSISLPETSPLLQGPRATGVIPCVLAAERDREGETGKIPCVTRSSELLEMLHQDKRDVAGVKKVVGRLTQDSEVREGEEETQRDVGRRRGGEEAGLGRDLERDPEEDGWGLFRPRKAAIDPWAPEEGKSVVAGTCNNEARAETGRLAPQSGLARRFQPNWKVVAEASTRIEWIQNICLETELLGLQFLWMWV